MALGVSLGVRLSGRHDDGNGKLELTLMLWIETD